MEALTAPRPPSTYSETPVVEGCEDIVSLASTDGNNGSNVTGGSEPRAPDTLRDDSQRDCSFKDGIKCDANKSGRQSDYHQRGPVEEPKPIWTKNRNRAFCHFLLLHFVPLTITMVLFWLYLKGFQWKANDIQLKALLFAARLHESLIVISLADILFHRIRYHLLTGRGISFGLLVAPFRVSSPFSLFQTPFLASARFALKSGPELVTVLLVVLVSLLALLSAPSSAALMLPRYDWWRIPNGEDAMERFMEQDLETATYIGASFEDLFSLVLDGRFAANPLRDVRLDTYSLSDRLGQIISGLDGVLVEGGLRANGNITLVDGATVDSIGLAYQEESLDECDVTAQDTSKFRSPDRLYLIWRQPSVSMQCSAIQPEYRDQPISFPHWGSFSPLHIYPDRQLTDRIMRAQNSPEPLAEYFDMSRIIPTGVTVSTALLITVRREPRDPNTTAYLCLVDARWIESDVWFTAPFATIMRSGASMESVQATTRSNTTTATSPAINITADYANSLNTNLTVDSSQFMYLACDDSRFSLASRPFTFIENSCFERVGTGLLPECSFLGHALYLTDSLRRTQSLFQFRTAKELEDAKDVSLLQPDQWTKLDYRLYHQLHAYKFEGAIIKLSMTVLLIHMMLVYAHLLLLVLGDGWCSSAWSELGELIALAILTRPSPLLQNTGGGVKNWQTWNVRTFVREVAPEGRLELVLKETQGSPRVLVELDEGREQDLVEPEADRRYG
ncbi:hypothetical protein F5883DRAFT_500749 [Diaporthe sp. PMI_573]|nr:hypothetical protein F5883DRAFT_500749 [Diaporthaceae sp. PMI_573]